MRFFDRAVLGILLVLVISFSAHRNTVHGQSVQIATAQNQLSVAFVAVQQAELQGVSEAQVSLLASNLNTALSYFENATALSTKDPSSSGVYANKSYALSSSTASDAQDLTASARSQLLLNQVGVYSLAVGAAFVLATLFVEFHRLRELVERTRTYRKSFD